MAKGSGISGLFYKITCPGCGAVFIADRKHRRFCGLRCMMRIYRAKETGEKFAEVPPAERLQSIPEGMKRIKYNEFDKLRRESK